MIELTTVILIYMTFMVLAIKRLMTYMHVLQQEDYYNSRLINWIFSNGAFDKRLTFGMIVLTIASPFIPTFFIGFMIFMSFIITIFLEKDPRKNVKKKLVLTSRVRRVLFPSILIMALLSAWVFLLPYPLSLSAWPWIFVLQLIPVCLIVMNLILMPVEQIIQKMYWNEAREKLDRLKPIVIGVTGSYGKTSVKHILGHILSTQAPTLVTPGSVNTPMGITRIIREQLTEDHKFFIVEMGAYGPGSIKDLCDLTPPDFGIITAIGHAHYERFKSLKTVAKAKYELAEAVLEKGEEGKVIVHERTLKYASARSLRAEHKDRFLVCGDSPDVVKKSAQDSSYLEEGDIQIFDVKQGPNGLEVKMGIDNKTYTLNPPLYGLHHGHNTTLAAIAALSVGMDIGQVQMALMSVPQIPHRLELKRKPEDKLTIIDDAYNSNPIGFRSALDLMTIINNGGRKILITPGMIELGVAHGDIHFQVGQYAGQVCDVGIVVTPKRIPTFVKGFKSSGEGKQLIEVETLQQALKWINDNKQENDLVLLENDLPDMYEHVPKM